MKRTMCQLTVLLFLQVLLFAGCALDDRSNERSTTEPDDRQALQNRAEIELVEENFRAVLIDSGDVLVLYTAQIRNGGDTTLLLYDVEVALVRSNGETMKQQRAAIYPDIVSPGQNSYISEAVLIGKASDKIEPDQIHHVNLTYSTSVSSQAAQAAVRVVAAKIKPDGDFPVLTVRVINTGDRPLSPVCVAAPVYSADGTLQTIVVAMINTLEPRESRTVEATATYAVVDADCHGAQVRVNAFVPFNMESVT